MQHAVIINHNAGSPYHGPNFRSYYAARGWIQNGMQATIVCSSFSHKLRQLPKVEGKYAIEMIDGIRYIWLRTPKFSNNVGRLLNYVQFQRRLGMLHDIIQEPVDHVVCSSPPPFWIWFCRRFAARKGASLIFEARDLWPDVIFETTRSGRMNPAAWLMRAAEITAYKKADSVVSVNESAIKIMQSRGLSSSRFWAIPNGVSIETEANDPDLPEAAQLCGRQKDKGMFVVGYAGALSRIYGLSYLAEAARSLKNEKIAFLLAGTGDYENELKRMADELPNFHLAGWIPKNQLNPFLRSVDICFAGLLDVPSFAYGSDSTKIYEYMKASRPVLHAIGNEDSVVVKAECGLRVAPENSGVLVEGILDLAAREPEELRAMGERGLEYLHRNRNYDVLVRKWIELFNSLGQKAIG
jgi:glycosyltransferase involved in cell wall biosynthesis